MTTRTLLIAVAALIGLALAAAPASATHSRGKCKARGDTIAKNDTGRVYEREQDAEVKTLWGCTWSRNKPFRMEVAEDDGFTTTDSYDNVMLRGRYVAWTFTHEDISCKADCPPDYDPTTEYVRTFDMRSLRRASATSDPESGTLRFNDQGSLAWLALAGNGNHDVVAWDLAGPRVLDTGAISKLRLRGTALTWINGTAGRSATLSGSATRRAASR